MLEVGIIICVGAIIFILLRRYPRGARDVFQSGRKNSNISSFKKLFGHQRHIEEEEIRETLSMGQEEIVTPREIETASESFKAEDPIIAKLLHEANHALKNEDLAVAEGKALEAISQDIRCDQAYAFMALVALKKSEWENAGAAAKTAIKCNSENAQAYAVLGEIALSEERYTEAIDNCLKAVMLNRNNAAWYGLLGQAYTEVRQFAKSAKAFKRAASLDLDNTEYRRKAAVAEEKQNSHARVLRSR